MGKLIVFAVIAILGWKLVEKDVPRRIGFMHLAARSSAIGMNHRHEALVCREDILAR